ncbi:mechanosensitive ion channel family protein [Halalkalicoccus sp. NIPERK01]|uniref:mechanosensitive ion channel family protein n=1 Tax=Halalkalicoccus sp. NIPERK01 TaxID=3053469 RepID=UPI00256EF59B|nr:mechanosensitive ion channel family protein [Halalkalicoccus sp. NIPERK01]MDL5361408.1 mechanosensitive ion channel family protein [Halalkalicoccus sp. NIPERK01]
MQIGQTIAETIESFLQWLVTSITGRLLLALAVVFVGWYVSGVVVRMLGRPVAQRFERQSLSRTILRTIKIGVILFSVAIAAGILGVGVGNIFLSVTVISAVVGVILAPVIGNYVGGLFVLADQPYEIGDMIEIVDAQQRGFIEDITLRYTKVLTEDNSVLVIPNATIRERDVINYTAEDERTRMTMDMTVTYEGDLAEARRLVVRAARQAEGVIAGGPTIRVGNARYPARPTCQIREYADHGVGLRLRYWVRTPYYASKVQSEIQERIWKELDDADVGIPYPHTHVVFDETSGEARVAMERAEDRVRPDPDVSRRP